MATDYLTLDQVCEALGVTAADIKAMVADGRLHEFRDAGKVFFKRGEVERMAAKEGSSIMDLAATDEMTAEPVADENTSFASALGSLADSSSSLGLGEISPLADIPADQPSELNLLDDEPAAASPSDSGSAMGMSPLDVSAEDFPEELPAAPARGAPAKRELTSEIDLLSDSDDEQQPAKPAPRPAASIPDLGLSGSSIISLEPSGEEEAPRPAPIAPKPAAKGISVFEDDEVEIAADPMGETRISAGVDELEAVGSGSGLLDLTQVSDDTSLGAELLDVISPTEAADTETEAVVEAAETVEDEGAIVAEPVDEEPMAVPVMAAATSAAVAPRMAASVAVDMPGGSLMNVTCLLGVLAMALVGLATAGHLQSAWPGFLTLIAKDVIHMSVFGGLAFVAILVGVLGILAGRK